MCLGSGWAWRCVSTSEWAIFPIDPKVTRGPGEGMWLPACFARLCGVEHTTSRCGRRGSLGPDAVPRKRLIPNVLWSLVCVVQHVTLITLTSGKGTSPWVQVVPVLCNCRRCVCPKLSDRHKHPLITAPDSPSAPGNHSSAFCLNLPARYLE